MHVGADAHSGLVHTARMTKASVHDAHMTDDLIRADDRAIFGDKGYVSDKCKRAALADGVLWAVKDKRKRGRKVTARLLPQFVGHDAFDHCRIAVLFDEELSHSSL